MDEHQSNTPSSTGSTPTTDTPTGADEAASHRRTWRVRVIIGCLLAFFIAGAAYAAYAVSTPPSAFPANRAFTIDEGEGVQAVVERLAADGYTRSSFALYLAIVALHDPRELKASTYVFSKPLTVFELATRLTEGDYGNDLISFTHIEGETAAALADRAVQTIPDFDRARFEELTENAEGRLFPDTYYVPPDFNAADLAALLQENYEAQLAPLRPAITEHPLSEAEIITLASIIEREANSPESMRMVSGILQNRLDTEMPLQADATIEYILDTPLNELPPGALAENLRELESPYNTYQNRGLPPTPIGNPGRTAIMAVLEPASTTARFYLTAPDGSFHYADTYAEHQANVDRYLRE